MDEQILKHMLRVLDSIRRNTEVLANQAMGKDVRFKPKPDPEVERLTGRGPVYNAVIIDELNSVNKGENR